MRPATIFKTFSQIEAQIIRSHLETAGFHPFVANENGPFTLGGFSKSTLIRVEVPENEAAAARELIDAPPA